MIMARVQTLVLKCLPSACCFPDPFQSVYTQNTFHLCLYLLVTWYLQILKLLTKADFTKVLVFHFHWLLPLFNMTCVM